MRSMVMKIVNIKYATHGKDSRKKLNMKRNTKDIKDTSGTSRNEQYNA